MTVAPWLDQVLAAGAVLDLHHPDGRAQLTARILAAIPKEQIATAIAGSARTVLEQKGLIGWNGVIHAGGGDPIAATPVCREIGRNAAGAVLFVLEEPLVDPDRGGGDQRINLDVDERTHDAIRDHAERRGIPMNAAVDELLGRLADDVEGSR